MGFLGHSCFLESIAFFPQAKTSSSSSEKSFRAVLAPALSVRV